MADSSLIEVALQTWQPYYREELSFRDGEEIVANWSAYLQVISEWVSLKSPQSGDVV